jgi:hypothetical protein
MYTLHSVMVKKIYPEIFWHEICFTTRTFQAMRHRLNAAHKELRG